MMMQEMIDDAGDEDDNDDEVEMHVEEQGREWCSCICSSYSRDKFDRWNRPIYYIANDELTFYVL